MRELNTSFRPEPASTEIAPFQIRRIGMHKEWVVEGGGTTLGRLKIINPLLSTTEVLEYRTETNVWTIHKKFWTAPFGTRSIHLDGLVIGQVTGLQPSYAPWAKLEPGILKLQGREIICRESNLRFDVECNQRRLFQIELPWRSWAIQEHVAYHLWPEEEFDSRADALLLIMPLLWLGAGKYEPIVSKS